MPAIYNEKKGYRNDPVCDSHVHYSTQMPIDRTAVILRTIMEYYGCDRLALLALPHSSEAAYDDPSNNLKALYLKWRLNRECPARRMYALGGLFHFFDGRDTASGFERQVRALWDMGFDGLKSLMGKPGLRKRLGIPLDDPLFKGVFRFCEEKRFPVTLHAGDPGDWWLPGAEGKAPVYGADYPPLEQIRAEVASLVEKHPGLDLTLCHFFFLGDDMERADRLLRDHPNVKLDLTPGVEMYDFFSRNPDAWRDFFHRHAKRLIFGSDTDIWAEPDTLDGYDPWFHYPYELERCALEYDRPFENHDFGLMNPLHLEDSALREIYFGNFIRRMGEPRPVDETLACLMAGKTLSLYEHDVLKTCAEERWDCDRKNLARIYEDFAKEGANT